jgi:hypothetical protein
MKAIHTFLDTTDTLTRLERAFYNVLCKLSFFLWTRIDELSSLKLKHVTLNCKTRVSK